MSDNHSSQIDDLSPQAATDAEIDTNEIDIEDLALEFALQKLVEEEIFTLAGLGRKEDGELLSIVVQADGDEEMFSQVNSFIAANPIVEIALVGTGKLEDADQTDILVIYAQTQSDDEVVCLIAPFEMTDQEDGTEFAVGEWHQTQSIKQKWVVAASN